MVFLCSLIFRIFNAYFNINFRLHNFYLLVILDFHFIYFITSQFVLIAFTCFIFYALICFFKFVLAL